MPASRPEGELRQVAAGLILQKIAGISVKEAADLLGVTRQAIYGFKSGEYCPSLAVIQRACEKWNIEFSLRGMKVSSSSFKAPPPKTKTPEPEPVQTSFFDLWSQLQDQRMTVVSAKRIDGAVEMTLRIALPAA